MRKKLQELEMTWVGKEKGRNLCRWCKLSAQRRYIIFSEDFL